MAQMENSTHWREVRKRERTEERRSASLSVIPVEANKGRRGLAEADNVMLLIIFNSSYNSVEKQNDHMGFGGETSEGIQNEELVHEISYPNHLKQYL